MDNVLSQWAAVDAPAPIQRATFKASRAHFPVALTDAERSLFLELIGRIDSNGQEEFWVRSENLAAAIGKSLRTIGSLMANLVAKGLIEKEQRRGRWGSFSSLTCKLTSRAADLLGLTNQPGPRPPPMSIRKKTADAITVKPDNVSQTSKGVGYQKTKGKLPLDLIGLFDAGISMPGIFKLMSIATKSGQKLGAVFEKNHDRVSKAKNPFAYLVRLLTSSNQTCEATEQSHAEVRNAIVRQQRKALAGKSFRTPKGRIARFSKDDASVCELWEPNTSGSQFVRTVAGPELFELLHHFSEKCMDWTLQSNALLLEPQC